MRAALLLALIACHREAAPAGPTVDVPVLPDERGTLPVDQGLTVTITATRVSIEGVGDFDPTKPDAIRERMRSSAVQGATLLLIDRAVTVRELDALYAGVFHRGPFGELELVVTTPKQRRMIVVENARALPSYENPTFLVITIGDKLFVGDQPVTLDELRARVAKSPADRVLVVAEPEVTVQRIAEAIAAAGGHATLGASLLPRRPEPIRTSRPDSDRAHR